MLGTLRTAAPLRIAFALALALKLFYALLAAWLAPHLFIDPAHVASNRLICPDCGLHDHLMPQSDSVAYRFSGVWERFDTPWYLLIAERGYGYAAAVVYFPLYPILIRALTPVLGPMQAGLAIAFAAAVLVFWALLRLVELDFGRDVALRTLAVAAVWPQSFILFAAYGDSLVLGLILAAMFLVRSGRAGAALPVAFLAGLAKSVGAFAAIPLAIYAWRQRSWRGAFAAAAPLAGTSVFAVYVRGLGFPSFAEVYAREWHIQASAPWDTVAALVGTLPNPHPTTVLSLTMLALISALLLVGRLPAPYWAFAAAVVGLFLTKKIDPPLASMARYLIVVFPAFVNLARTRWWVWTLPGLAVVNTLIFITFLKWWFYV